MKLGVVVSTADPETVWNAFRLTNFSLGKEDEVRVFLVGKSVEYEKTSELKFDSVVEAKRFLQAGGGITACETCLELRQEEGNEICPLSTLKDLYELVKESDKIVTL